MSTYRVVGGVLVFVLAIVLPWWAMVPCALLYACVFRAYELILLAAMIDGFFGTGSTFPYYTIGVLLILLFAEWIKPSLAFLKNLERI